MDKRVVFTSAFVYHIISSLYVFQNSFVCCFLSVYRISFICSFREKSISGKSSQFFST